LSERIQLTPRPEFRRPTKAGPVDDEGSIPFTRSNLFNHLAALGIAGDTLPGCSGDTFAPDLFVARILPAWKASGARAISRLILTEVSVLRHEDAPLL
jgi:hypothetical protein